MATIPAVKGLLTAALLVCTAALLTSGCGEAKKAAAAPAAAAKPTCAYPRGWQKLANRIKAPVYCPGWLPDPLQGQIGGEWNNINAVDPDRSYLESFVWQETGGGAAGGELHVNLRGYPGRTAIPKCRTVNTVEGVTHRGLTPCFAGRRGGDAVNGIKATMYTVNQ